MFKTALVHVCVVCLDANSNWDYDYAMQKADERDTCAVCGLYAKGVRVEGPVCIDSGCGRVIGCCPHTPTGQSFKIFLPQ